MTRVLSRPPAHPLPSPGVVLELLKPITWFPPMWAFACGVVSAGVPLRDQWPVLLLALLYGLGARGCWTLYDNQS
ncbi:MAG: bacteriochlorophyll/chlorophyll synthetase, partial [Pseudomonadota bacterium]